MFFCLSLNDTFSPSQSAAEGKQLAVLSPGSSPATPHTGSENEIEAVRLVCDQTGRQILSRPLPLTTNERTPFVLATRFSIDEEYCAVSMLRLSLSLKVHSVARHSGNQTPNLKSLSKGSLQLSLIHVNVQCNERINTTRSLLKSNYPDFAFVSTFLFCC